MDTRNADWMLAGFVPLNRLTLAYFPGITNKRSICRAFHRALERYPLLKKDLEEAEYLEGAHELSPRQVTTIIRHWGMPTEAGLELTKHPYLWGTKLDRDKLFD